jgi:hypothetical protein
MNEKNDKSLTLTHIENAKSSLRPRVQQLPPAEEKGKTDESYRVNFSFMSLL